MVNTKKLISLGLLAAVGANFVLAPAASAAGNGATNFVYTPGQVSGGGDGSDGNGNGGDGSNATWTVSYPVQTDIADGNTKGHAASLNFKVSATSGSGDISTVLQGKKITITPDKPSVTLVNKGNGGDSVTLQLATGSDAANTTDLTADKAIAELTGSEPTSTGYAYLSNADNVKVGDVYSGKAVWDITATIGS